jgi:NAD-dependent histone deacetylase SIR2
VLAKELYPGKFYPTVSHVFIALLASKGILFHLFTQNIDCLERAAGVPAELIVEAHGSFATQRCIDCGTEYPDSMMKVHVAKGEVPRCIRKDNIETKCEGLVKPDIVFFGEQLPAIFRARQHYPAMADLALVMGTSLQVHPFAGLPDSVLEDVPRALFNMERVGNLGTSADDVLFLGDCDSGVRELADALGWRDELEARWRSIVGDEEADRQLRNAQKREQVMEDEVVKLAEEVEQVLQLGGESSDGSEVDGANKGHEGREVQEAKGCVQTTTSPPIQDSDTGQPLSLQEKEVSGTATTSSGPSSAPSVEPTPAPEPDTSGSARADTDGRGQGQPQSVPSTESNSNENEGQVGVSSEEHERTTSPTPEKAAL